MDAIGMGIGFTFALSCIAFFRELVGAGKLFDHAVLPAAYQPVLIFILPAGAFLTMGFVFAAVNYFKERGAHNA